MIALFACMMIVPFCMPFLSCSFFITFSISFIVFMRSMVFISDFKTLFYCLFFSQCRFRFSMTFLILYDKLCNYFVWHDALRAIVVWAENMILASELCKSFDYFVMLEFAREGDLFI